MVSGFDVCDLCCSELRGLGVQDADLGIVLESWEAVNTSQDWRGRLSPLAIGNNSRVTPPAPNASPRGERVLYASEGYPAQMLAEWWGRRSFGCVLSERDTAALAASIAEYGASVWARTNDLELAAKIAAFLLGVSPTRVRTFTTPANSIARQGASS